MRWIQHGRLGAEPMYPSDTDFVVVTNEDLGFTATLDTSLNHLNTTLPYPQEWDQDSEVVVLRKLQIFLHDLEYPADDVFEMAATNLSYLDRNPNAANYQGVGADTEDEYHKSLFAHGMACGHSINFESATANVAFGNITQGDSQIGASYVPEIPLSMFFPIYLDIYGSAAANALLTGNETQSTFTFFERYTIRYFYNIRRMNSAERSLQEALAGAPMRWAQLGS